jgi:hypothetical protein
MGATTPEGKVKKRLTEMLRTHKIWFYFPGNNGFGKSGLPDIVAIVKGRFVGIEVKADRTKKPTALQWKTGREIKEAGGDWFLVYDDDTIKIVEEYICARSRKGQSPRAEAEQS